MKQGMTVTELGKILRTQQEQRLDVKLDSKNVSFYVEHKGDATEPLRGPVKAYVKMPASATLVENVKDLPQALHLDINQTAHGHLAQKLEIPKKYYDELHRKHPSLLRYNLSYLCANVENRFMLRTFIDRHESDNGRNDGHGKLRAVLSDKYRRLDNFELLQQSILPVLQTDPQFNIDSCNVDDDKFYFKATTPRKTHELRRGDPVQVGFVVENSETGKSSLRVHMFINRLVCLNGLIAADTMRKYHVGRAEEDSVSFRDATMRVDDRAFFMKVRDTISQVTDEARVENVLNIFRESMKYEISKPKDTVDVLKDYGLSESERDNVLANLLQFSHRDGLTMFGLVNAVTAAAENCEDYERANELEKLGGVLLNLPKNEREKILVTA